LGQLLELRQGLSRACSISYDIDAIVRSHGSKNMSDRFEELRTFVAVVKGKGFNAAATKLGIVRSAVSKRVSDLEDRLGIRLINRTTRGISLTEAGAVLFDRGLTLLADLQDAEDLATMGSNAPVGRIRMSAPVSLTVHCLAPVIGEFLEQHPRIHLEIEEDDRLVDIIDEGFDMAVRITSLKNSTLIQRRLATVRHVCCASPAYLRKHGRPKTPADVRHHRGIVYGNVEPRQYWMFRDGQSVETQSSLMFNNGDAIREAAIAGGGLVILPTFIAHRAIERGELEIVLKSFMREPMAMFAVYPSSRNPPAKLRVFIDFLVRRFGNEPFWERENSSKK